MRADMEAIAVCTRARLPDRVCMMPACGRNTHHCEIANKGCMHRGAPHGRCQAQRHAATILQAVVHDELNSDCRNTWSTTRSSRLRGCRHCRSIRRPASSCPAMPPIPGSAWYLRPVRAVQRRHRPQPCAEGRARHICSTGPLCAVEYARGVVDTNAQRICALCQSHQNRGDPHRVKLRPRCVPRKRVACFPD